MMASKEKINELLQFITRTRMIHIYISGATPGQLYKSIPDPHADSNEDLTVIVPSPEAGSKLINFINDLGKQTLAMILTRNGMHLNRRKAIRLKCLDCSGFLWNDVKDCEHTACPLHPYRSGQGKQEPVSRNKAIREFCSWCVVDQKHEVRKCGVADCPLYKFRGFLVKKQHIGASSDTISVK